MKTNSTVITELYGRNTQSSNQISEAFRYQTCPYLQDHQCKKMKGGRDKESIGSCSINYLDDNLIICPHRMLENQQIFIDCLNLLHFEPGDTLYAIPETQLSPNQSCGIVDYMLTAIHGNKMRDVVGIEIQTLSTTGSIWKLRQTMLWQNDLIPLSEVSPGKGVAINWKTTAKNILVQMQQKSRIFEHYNKHLVLVIQEPFWNYLQKEFNCNVFHSPSTQDTVYLHTYNFTRNSQKDKNLHLSFQSQYSTTAHGMAKCLEQNEEQEDLYDLETVLVSKACDKYRLSLFS